MLKSLSRLVDKLARQTTLAEVFVHLLSLSQQGSTLEEKIFETPFPKGLGVQESKQKISKAFFRKMRNIYQVYPFPYGVQHSYIEDGLFFFGFSDILIRGVCSGV